jgi:threonine aldolase
MTDMIDLRSDTVTQPTDEMREAMARAVVGDDVFGEDPTVNDLEALAASMLGKEAGLFVPTGTMANLVAVLTHTQKGEEVFVESDSHIYCNEVGSMSAVAGASPHPIAGRAGYVAPEQLRDAVRPSNIHFPIPRLLCVENTHNRAGGVPLTPQEMDAICVTAHELGLVVHVDGARIFNAAVALGVPAPILVRHADSAMFCVSKGLSAPVGSVLVGSRAFIDRARRFRKMVGGGMRQAGVIAAAGVVALKTMVGRLAEDHANARALAEGIAHVPGLSVDITRVRTNIVQVRVTGPFTGPEFTDRLREAEVLALPSGPATIRMVTHRHISAPDVRRAIEAIRQTAALPANR